MYCPNCGKKIVDLNQEICEKCGFDLPGEINNKLFVQKTSVQSETEVQAQKGDEDFKVDNFYPNPVYRPLLIPPLFVVIFMDLIFIINTPHHYIIIHHTIRVLFIADFVHRQKDFLIIAKNIDNYLNTKHYCNKKDSNFLSLNF